MGKEGAEVLTGRQDSREVLISVVRRQGFAFSVGWEGQEAECGVMA